MTDTALTAQQSFNQKVEDRIRESIGELIPDEVLSVMIEQVMQKAFFEGRTVTVGSGYHSSTETKPSVLQEVITELMDKKVKEAVAKWMEDNQELVSNQLKEHIEAGIDGAVLGAINRFFTDSLDQLECSIMNKIGS